VNSDYLDIITFVSCQFRLAVALSIEGGYKQNLHDNGNRQAFHVYGVYIKSENQTHILNYNHLIGPSHMQSVFILIFKCAFHLLTIKNVLDPPLWYIEEKSKITPHICQLRVANTSVSLPWNEQSSSVSKSSSLKQSEHLSNDAFSMSDIFIVSNPHKQHVETQTGEDLYRSSLTLIMQNADILKICADKYPDLLWQFIMYNK
jgi:hypothetical protein